MSAYSRLYSNNTIGSIRSLCIQFNGEWSTMRYIFIFPLLFLSWWGPYTGELPSTFHMILQNKHKVRSSIRPIIANILSQSKRNSSFTYCKDFYLKRGGIDPRFREIFFPRFFPPFIRLIENVWKWVCVFARKGIDWPSDLASNSP